MPDKRFDDRQRMAESRGMILGALAAGEEPKLAAGLVAPVTDRDAREPNFAFANECLRDLRKGRLDLPASLRDKSLPLARRIELLCAFARGLLSGLGQAGARLEALGADAVEMLSDIEMLSRGADPEGGDEAGAEERAYRELLEYLRFVSLYFYRALA